MLVSYSYANLFPAVCFRCIADFFHDSNYFVFLFQVSDFKAELMAGEWNAFHFIII